MRQPRVPKLHIIDSDRPEPKLEQSAHPWRSRPRREKNSKAMGFFLLLLAFSMLAVALVCSKFLVPAIYFPVFAFIAALMSVPLLIASVIKLD